MTLTHTLKRKQNPSSTIQNFHKKPRNIPFSKNLHALLESTVILRYANISLRPIVGAFGLPTGNLARYPTKELQPIIKTSYSHVKNSSHFIQSLKNTINKNTDNLVSFDVVSIFTIIPLDTLAILKRKYQLNQDTLSLIDYYISNTHILFQDKLNKQIKGSHVIFSLPITCQHLHGSI